MAISKIPLIGFDKFKGTFSADELNEYSTFEFKRCLGARYPLIVQGLTDGGDGFLDQMTRNWGSQNLMEVPDMLLAEKYSEELTGPVELGRRRFKIGLIPNREVPTGFCLDFDIGPGESIGIIEMARISGMALIQKAECHPYRTSTANIGHAIRFLGKLDVKHILLGVGGSATNDLGCGCLQILGARFLDKNDLEIDDIRPMDFPAVKSIDLSRVQQIPWLIITCDVDNPLLGPDGCTRQFAPQKGLLPGEIEDAENQLTRIATLLAEAADKPFSMADEFGMGAAGGIGYGLTMAFGARMMKGFYLFSNWVDLEDKISKSTWVVTGEGKFDKTSLYGKAPAEILRFAASEGKKLALVCPVIDRDALGILEEELGTTIHSWELSPNREILSPELTAERLRRAIHEIADLITHDNDNDTLI